MNEGQNCPMNPHGLAESQRHPFLIHCFAEGVCDHEDFAFKFIRRTNLFGIQVFCSCFICFIGVTEKLHFSKRDFERDEKTWMIFLQATCLPLPSAVWKLKIVTLDIVILLDLSFYKNCDTNDRWLRLLLNFDFHLHLSPLCLVLQVRRMTVPQMYHNLLEVLKVVKESKDSRLFIFFPCS